jgi:regulator of nucleoside diphosphate kinase
MQLKTHPIIVTEFDHRRLEGLLELLRARSTVDARYLRELEEELDRAEIVEPAAVPDDVVTMNSEVQLRDLDSGDRLQVTLVFPGTAEANQGRVSVLAPIGLALLGCREAEELSWPTPSRVRRMRVERVLFQPEAAGNFTL